MECEEKQGTLSSFALGTAHLLEPPIHSSNHKCPLSCSHCSSHYVCISKEVTVAGSNLPRAAIPPGRNLQLDYSHCLALFKWHVMSQSDRLYLECKPNPAPLTDAKRRIKALSGTHQGKVLLNLGMNSDNEKVHILCNFQEIIVDKS